MKRWKLTFLLFCVMPAVFAAPTTAAPEAAAVATAAPSTTPATLEANTEAVTPATPAETATSATTPTAPVVLLPGDAQRGLEKSQTCVACHGADGNSVIPDYPKISGQHANYIIQSLKEYRAGPAGGRNNPIMYGMVANLSDQDILDLAAYYSEQKITTGEADPSLFELGEKIYRGGNLEANVPACIACHGPRGEGNALANFPTLHGQNAGYIAAQLHAFRTGARSGGVNDMMAHVVARMSEEEIKAVSSYISGLH